jgi:hypothetical protein
MKGKLSAACKAGWEFLATHRKWVLRGTIGASVAFIVLLIHRSAYDLLSAQPDFKIKPTASVKVAPPWSREESVVEIPADLNLFDDGLVARLGRSFEDNPWVRRVIAVERAFPDRVRVRFEARRPHVAIRRSEGLYLVDQDGVLLPGVYASAPACTRQIELIGSASVPPKPGKRWNDLEVRTGLELVELAATTPSLSALGIKSVDVSNAGGRVDRRRPETAFVTATGCAIYWGRAPSEARFGEPSPADKLGLLAAVLREYPKLDGLKYVKLDRKSVV